MHCAKWIRPSVRRYWNNECKETGDNPPSLSLSVLLLVHECTAEIPQCPLLRMILVMRGIWVFNSVQEHLILLSDPTPVPLVSLYRLSDIIASHCPFLPARLLPQLISFSNYSSFPSTCHVFNVFAAELGSSFRSMSLVTNQCVGVCLLLQNLE